MLHAPPLPFLPEQLHGRPDNLFRLNQHPARSTARIRGVAVRRIVAGRMALELDVYVLCRRERRHVEAFLEAYAEPAQVDPEVELGFEHPERASVSYMPAAATAPTDQCCVAFTSDGHVILGLDLVDPGSRGDDGLEVDPVPVLERLVADHDALAGLIGWEVTPFGTAREFEEMLRGERSAGVGEVRRDLPRYLHGAWLAR